jgi:tRNA dimethylallyltransferase
MCKISSNYITVIGPTASGKSTLAMDLASKLSGEIVACDSVQVYRGFNVGSAKPTVCDQNKITHHMLDCVEANKNFTASCYKEKTRIIIQDIQKRNKLPIIVVGTSLYFRALLQNNFHNLPSNPSLRETFKKLTCTEIYERLLAKDPERAQQIHINDHFRLARALEIISISGKSFAELTNKKQLNTSLTKPPKLTIFIDPPRPKVHELIAKRAQEMLAAGLIDEVKLLLKNGVKEDSKPMQSIGYKQVLDYLRGIISEDDLLTKIICATRQYSKRQMTVLKKSPYDIKIENKEQINLHTQIIKEKFSDYC